MITPLTTLVLVTTFGAAMFATGAIQGRADTLERFLVAKRSVGLISGALSVAASWIWAPALFIAAQKAYQQGLPGLIWFTVPNVGCLILFAFLAARIRRVFPHGYTLPQYIAARFDSRTHRIYIFTFLSLQVCALGVQLIAGAALLNAMSGLPYVAGVLILAGIFTSYSVIDGLRASVRTDVFQMIVIFFGMAVLIPLAFHNGGGLATLKAGLSGVSGNFGNPFDPYVAYTFGITVTIGLMSGPVGDQQHWQRAFAFREGQAFRGYLLGALIFAVVPLAMSIPGFMAAGNPQAAPGVYAGTLSAQQVGPEVIRTLLPPWGMLIFMVMILCGLASTGDSALCAGGSLIAVDIYQRYMAPDAPEEHILRISRLSVLGISALSVAIALIPGISVLSLFLFYGTLRSSTLMPTLVLLFRKNIPPWGIFWGVALAILLGLPAYLFGQMTGNTGLRVGANIGIVLISLTLPCLAAALRTRSGAR
ncbi:hypothetical protein DENIS_4032 [Desulfonema ishimotonii]|uniref:Sodium:solute symporter n=1 Tax=Desulfonema ishimotonii TaxID=45657 RepID=A0A401G1H7_9BACT|nr:hypothetical protein [Desulfonema ishimotonii]GBC63043.1 hypothetical protein DENIS_4032 [Desulfonema ishimotonii]